MPLKYFSPPPSSYRHNVIVFTYAALFICIKATSFRNCTIQCPTTARQLQLKMQSTTRLSNPFQKVLSFFNFWEIINTLNMSGTSKSSNVHPINYRFLGLKFCNAWKQLDKFQIPIRLPTLNIGLPNFLSSSITDNGD